MELQYYWLVLKRRWFPAILTFATISALSVAALRLQEPIYRAQGRLRFIRDATPALTGVGEEQGNLAPLITDTSLISTEMGVIRSIPIIQATIAELDLRNEAGEPLKPSQFLNRLNLNAERGTDLLEIAYVDADAQRAEAVVNVLMKIYLEKHLEENRAQTVAAREFIEWQLPKAETTVQRAEAALRQFKEANRVASLEDEAAAIVSAQEELRRRITEAGSQLADANAQSAEFYRQLRMNPQQAMAATALSQSPGVQEALTQLQTIEAQLAIERVRFYDAHPLISDLEARRSNLLSLLDQRIDHTLQNQARPTTNLQIGELQSALSGEFVRAEIRRQGLTQQFATLSTAQTFYQQRISTLPRLEQEQRELLRQLEAAQSTYSLLLSRLYETQVAENQNVGNARIVQDAYVSESPVSPRPLSYLMMSGIIAAIAAGALAVALEAADQSIRTVKQAREQFGMALLGVIPFSRGLFSLTDRHHPATVEVIVRDRLNTPVHESFQALRATLKYLATERQLKTIVITSAATQEGKSVVAANLAMSIAQAGRRVLLVDGNLRSPVQHCIWHRPNTTGLSNLLMDAADLSTAVQPVAENLELLTAGTTSFNPAALLESQHMTGLIEQFALTYDIVLLDTPSLSAAVDALVLSEIADGVMLITRPGYMDVVNANIAKERLHRLGEKVLGQVINGVGDETEPYRDRDYQSTHSNGNGNGHTNGQSHTPILTKR